MELATYPGLDERIVILRAGELVDAVFVRTARFGVLVDTLDSPQACREALALLGARAADRPLFVVNSHMDWDHFWGNAAVADAPIIAHETARQRFEGAAVRDVLAEKRREDARYADVELRGPNVTFTDTLRLDGGDLVLELVHTPGHTPDHVAVWIPALRTCLAVDAAEDPIPQVWSDDPADLAALLASLRRIRDLRAEHVVLAHGRTSDPKAVERNLAYFETLAERAKTLAREDGEGGTLPPGLRLADLVPAVEALPPAARDFYEGFHRANLAATLRADREARQG